jgi:O-antigen ligase
VLFLTFSGALTASTFLALITMAVLERRWGLSLLVVVLVAGFFQIPSVQQRWFREVAIISGEEDVIAFASGRPHRWQRFLDRHGDAPITEKLVGVHGRWGNPENGLLHLLVDLGIMGTVATLLLLGHAGMSMLRWWREEDDPRVKLLHGLTFSVAVGYGAAWATGTPFAWINYQWFLWSCLGACAALRARVSTVEGRPAFRG